VASRIARGDLRLYHFAPPDKKRPVLVLTRDSDGMEGPCAVNPHNAVTISQDRLGRRVAHLSSSRINQVCAALRFSLGCDFSSS
jgi:mRNA-degrading endonuclease toxin of MazEF toxin-antitoxin module